jgi:hypothetical protein
MDGEKDMTAYLKTLLLAGAAAFVLALVADVGTAQADRTVRANEPVVWFDDVRGTALEIVFPEGSASDNNRSGLGDETNAGTGDGTDNATNEGTDNPNEASGPSASSQGHGPK